MEYVALAIFILLVVAGWLLNLFSLPGNWLIVAAAAAFAWLADEEYRFDISLTVVLILVGFAVVGELVEFAAGALGAAKQGGSKRGAVLAICGSIVGAVVGAIVGLPIPGIGSLLGVVLFASAGAMAGAMLGESWKGRTLEQTWQVGQAAFWGRLMGTVAKTLIGSAMALLAAVAAIAPRL